MAGEGSQAGRGMRIRPPRSEADQLIHDAESWLVWNDALIYWNGHVMRDESMRVYDLEYVIVEIAKYLSDHGRTALSADVKKQVYAAGLTDDQYGNKLIARARDVLGIEITQATTGDRRRTQWHLHRRFFVAVDPEWEASQVQS